jgi:hypothetical protein
MKAKTFSKKLVLNKKTIANVRETEMRDVHGGISGATCPVCTVGINCMSRTCTDLLTNCLDCPPIPDTE